MTYLEFQKVSHAYAGGGAVLAALELAVPRGQFVSLLGRSGCGKTTLLRMAAGLLMPDEGCVMLQGERVSKPSDAVAMVFQSPVLLPWLTVLENVILPFTLSKGRVERRFEREQVIDRAKTLLEQVGLEELADRQPSRLSGGQQSRVALVRALLLEPDVLLMDEPFAALDALTRETLQEELRAMCESEGKTVLFVTHDIHEAAFMSDRVVTLSQGRICSDRRVPFAGRRNAELRYTEPYGSLCRLLRTDVFEEGEVRQDA